MVKLNKDNLMTFTIFVAYFGQLSNLTFYTTLNSIIGPFDIYASLWFRCMLKGLSWEEKIIFQLKMWNSLV